MDIKLLAIYLTDDLHFFRTPCPSWCPNLLFIAYFPYVYQTTAKICLSRLALRPDFGQEGPPG